MTLQDDVPAGGAAHTQHHRDVAFALDEMTSHVDATIIYARTTAATAFEGTQYSNNNVPPYLVLQKSRGSTVGVLSPVLDDTTLGGIMFKGWDGTSWVQGASILVKCDGLVTTDGMPTRMLLQTSNPGGSAPQPRIKIGSDGIVLIGLGADDSSDANAILELSKGINFPDTQVASTDANTLDDYEEGTWAPVLFFAVTGNMSVAYTTQVGRYTKIGRLVHYSVRITTSSFTHTTASSSLLIAGLPFTSSADSIGEAATTMGGWTKAGYTHPTVENQAGTAFLRVLASGSGVGVSGIAAADCPSGGTIEIVATGTYEV